jgi:spore photoproduct lyase
MRRYRPEEILVERGEEDSPLVRRARERLPDVPVRLVEGYARSVEGGGGDFGRAKRRLFFTRQKGSFLEHCSAGTTGLVCCNYLTLVPITNCPMDCTYCFLQEYLANNPTLKVFTNVDAMLREVAAAVDRHPRRSFRIGTGALSDSLALDPIIGLSGDLVPFFAARRNVLLELKTKSDCVEELLRHDPRDRVVVSWSVSPLEIASAEEHGAASFEERLAAARRCEAAGYRLGFHFDPMIEYPGWEEGYRGAIDRIFSAADARRVAWVSVGGLRLTPRLRAIVRARFPESRVLTTEQVPCRDGKWRDFQPLRVKMYRALVGWIKEAAPSVPVYLCMETREVWEKVFGRAPSGDREVAAGLTRPIVGGGEGYGSMSLLPDHCG